MPTKDITGQRFGKLTAVKRTENQGSYVCWLFRCDCGNEKATPIRYVTKKNYPVTNCRNCPEKPRAEKICCACKTNFPLDCFITNNHSKDGHGTRCKRCQLVWYYTTKNYQGDIDEKVDKILARRKFLTENPNLKKCWTCNQYLPKENFPPLKTTKDGLKAKCRECSGQYQHNYSKSYYSKNREKRIKQSKDYVQNNQEKVIKWRRQHYKKNKDRLSVKYRQYRQDNKEKLRESYKKDYKKNKVYYLTNARNRKARLKAAQGTFTAKQWQAKIDFFGNRCYLCGESLKGKTVHAEHRIPIIRGGSNWIANVAPSCETCNLSKGKMTEQEFRARFNLPTVFFSK